MFLFPTPAHLGLLELPTNEARRERRTLAPFVPSEPTVVDAMLDLADLRPDDFLIDLGCGDGRIVFSAARRGVRALGIDIDPVFVADNLERIAEHPDHARAHFIQGDVCEADISDATVVTCYLLNASMEVLRPKFETTLRPGTRIVSHAFTLGGGWAPARMAYPEDRLGTVYLWVA